MSTTSKKILVSSLVALTLAGTLASAPAQAKPFYYHHHHYGYGWGVAGLLGGIAIGGMLAASAAPSYDCGVIRRAVVNPYGEIVGYRYISAC